MTAKECVQKAANVLMRAETACSSLPPGQSLDYLIRIAERWDNLAYQIDALEDSSLRRKLADTQRELDLLKKAETNQ